MNGVTFAKRTQREHLQAIAQNGAARHRSQKRRENIESRFRHKQKADIRAHHENAAVRHVDDVQHAEDQRVTDGDDGIGASQRKAVDKLLKKHDRLLLPLNTFRVIRYSMAEKG